MTDTQQRIFHAVHMSCATRKKRICPICDNTYYATPDHKWLAHVSSTSYKDPVCSYTCMRRVERKEGAEREKRRQAQEERAQERRERREKMRAEKQAERAAQKQPIPTATLHAQMVECTRRHEELLAFRDKPAYKRLPERDRRSISRKIGYYYKRREKLRKEIEERVIRLGVEAICLENTT